MSARKGEIKDSSANRLDWINHSAQNLVGSGRLDGLRHYLFHVTDPGVFFSTQWLLAPRCSFFQKGARCLRASTIFDVAVIASAR